MPMVDKAGIEKMIPHRGDMLLIDEIAYCDENKGIGIRRINDNEFWCCGHFPGDPIMPGVLQVEALAQTACFVAFASMPPRTDGKSNMGYFTSIDKIKFVKMVRPGDVLELHVELKAKKMGFYKFDGIAKVNGEEVSRASFSAMLG
jgi:3-hydroxyacyl-[acyl-carrier-protein] dehydratase